MPPLAGTVGTKVLSTTVPGPMGLFCSDFYFEGIRAGAADSLSFPSLLQSYARGALISWIKKATKDHLDQFRQQSTLCAEEKLGNYSTASRLRPWTR